MWVIHTIFYSSTVPNSKSSMLRPSRTFEVTTTIWNVCILVPLIFSLHFPSSRGQDEEKKDDEPSTLEQMKQIKCLYRKILTCGISDDKTDCIKYSTNHFEELQEHVMDKYPFEMKQSDKYKYKKDALATIESLKSLVPEAKKMCSAALGLYCTNKGTCSLDSDGQFVYSVLRLSQASDWEEDDTDCGDSSGETDYTKCPVKLNVTPKSKDDDIKKIKCLHKKIVNCGISELYADEEKCTAYDATAIEGLANISSKRSDELKREVYKTGPEAEAAMEWLKGIEPKFREMCLLSEGLSCVDGKCQRGCTGEKTICDRVREISRSAGYQNNDCGDSAKCEKKPDKPATAEDGKHFKEQLQDLFGDSGQNDGWECDVQSSSDFVIEYGKVLKDTDEEVKNWLERKEHIKNHQEAKQFTHRITKESGKICAAKKDLVCIPDRIDLDRWSEKGTCMQCGQVQNDTSFDMRFRSVCTQFVAKLKTEVKDEPEESSANPTSVQLGQYQIVFVLCGSLLLLTLITSI